jgi:rhamnosyltransferase
MNDLSFIEKTLTAVLNQKFKDFELINIDSGSTDGAYEIIKKYNPDKSYQIRREDYVPGRVLNNAVKLCSGEIIVFNNSDCIPMNSDWLGNLIKPLLEHPEIVAVFGNQIPRPDAAPLVIKDYRRAFGDGSISASWGHFFSLATSAVRKCDIMRHPFNESLKYSEDSEWSWRMKRAGWEIAYAPDAVVEHSHNYALREVWKRFYNEGLADGFIYGGKKSFPAGMLLPFGVEACRDIEFLIRNGRIAYIPYGLVYRFIQRLSAWKGRRDFLKRP